MPMGAAADRFAVVVNGWFDGERRRSGGPTTLLVEGGTLADLSAGDNGGALAAQGIPVTRGDFLIPGLIDAHVHLFLDGAPTDAGVRAQHLKQSVEALTETARASARQALAAGVTLVRDAGDRHGINHAIRQEARERPDTLAQVRSAGVGLKRPKRYGAFMARDVIDENDIVRSVPELAAASDEIKLILSGIIDFEAGAVTDEPQFTGPEARLVVETARAWGRATFAHCSGPKGLAVAVEADVASIEHGFFMSRDILARMAEKGIAWTPTFCPVHFQWAHPEAVGWSPATVDNLRRILDGHREHLAMAADLGVPLLIGTDAGSMGVVHGAALFDEIDRFLEAGLSLETTLTAATAAPRRHFGMRHARLDKGAPFDAVLLESSPFDDPAALRRPQRVWSAGCAA